MADDKQYLFLVCILEDPRWVKGLDDACLKDHPLRLRVERERVFVIYPTLDRKKRLKETVIGELPGYQARRARELMREGVEIDTSLVQAEEFEELIRVRLFAQGHDVRRAHAEARECRKAQNEYLNTARSSHEAELEADAEERAARRRQKLNAILGASAGGAKKGAAVGLKGAFMASVLMIAGLRKYWTWIVRKTND